MILKPLINMSHTESLINILYTDDNKILDARGVLNRITIV